MGEPQLGGEIFPLALELCAGFLELTVELGQFAAGDGQLPPRAVELPAQTTGLLFDVTQLFIQILSFGLVTTGLGLERTDLLAHLGQLIFSLAGLTRSQGRLRHKQQQAETRTEQQSAHGAGSVGDSGCVDDGGKPDIASHAHGYNAAPARSGTMDRLLEFITANPLLVAATLLMAIAVIAVEIQLRARALLEISTAEAVRMINRGATVVDIRDQTRFDAGHIVDAVHMEPAELSRGEEGRIKKKRGVLVVCDNGGPSYRAVKALRAAGFDGAFSLKGGIGSWQRDGQPLVTGKR
jgi:rhodanese-related sulfurtransferase